MQKQPPANPPVQCSPTSAHYFILIHAWQIPARGHLNDKRRPSAVPLIRVLKSSRAWLPKQKKFPNVKQLRERNALVMTPGK